MAKVIAQVPPVIESLTGLRVDQLVERLGRAEAPKSPIRPVGSAEATPP